jgi:hypothetical protein
VTPSPPEAPARYACGCTHEWIEDVLSVIHPGEQPEWFLQLRDDRPRHGWWHVASSQVRYHVFQDGRWREAHAPLVGVDPNTLSWRFLDDNA